MAFWNAPLDVPDHRNLAIRSALDMLGAVRELNQSFQEQFGIQINIRLRTDITALNFNTLK